MRARHPDFRRFTHSSCTAILYNTSFGVLFVLFFFNPAQGVGGLLSGKRDQCPPRQRCGAERVLRRQALDGLRAAVPHRRRNREVGGDSKRKNKKSGTSPTAAAAGGDRYRKHVTSINSKVTSSRPYHLTTRKIPRICSPCNKN